eukprot:205979_1
MKRHVLKWTKAMNEIDIMIALQHKNIIYLVHFCKKRNCLYRVTAPCFGGNALNHLLRGNESMIAHIMKPIGEALVYLHSEHIIHCNLTLDTVLYALEDQIGSQCIRPCRWCDE